MGFDKYESKLCVYIYIYIALDSNNRLLNISSITSSFNLGICNFVLHFLDEELIKWGWPEDVWFHVDKVSSAHVYLRLKSGQTIDDVPQAVIEDAAQLVKANSIQGNKMNDIDVVYTMWSNLKKTDSMDVGEVFFFKDKEVCFEYIIYNQQVVYSLQLIIIIIIT